MLLSEVTRKQAFLSHLSISFTVFLVMLVLILFYWYPSFYLTLDGGVRGIATIFFVDVVLGPGLTLLVYKQGKPSLKFDMAVIILLQLAALAWGVSKVYEDRPVAAVFYLGNITCVGSTTVEGVPDAISDGEFSTQKLAFLKRPDTLADYTDFLRTAMDAGSSEIYYYADRYEPIDMDNVDRIRSYRLDMQQLRDENETGADMVQAFIEQNPGYGESYGLYPLSCRFGAGIAVFDFNIREIVETLPALDEKSRLRAETSIPLR